MLSDDYLEKVEGGISITNALFNTILKFVNFTLDFGKTVGSVIRRGTTKNYC